MKNNEWDLLSSSARATLLPVSRFCSLSLSSPKSSNSSLILRSNRRAGKTQNVKITTCTWYVLIYLAQIQIKHVKLLYNDWEHYYTIIEKNSFQQKPNLTRCYFISIDNTYRIVPNRGAMRQNNGLEIHNLETELILPVFKAKLYHYLFQRYWSLKITVHLKSINSRLSSIQDYQNFKRLFLSKEIW